MRDMNTLMTAWFVLALSGATATATVDTQPCLSSAATSRSTLACDELLALADIPATHRATVLSARARIHDRVGATEAAQADLDAAISMQPTNAALWTQRALVALRAGDTASALRDYDEAVRLTARAAPGLRARALYNRAFAHRARGDLAAAAEDINAAVALYSGPATGTSGPSS